METHFSHTDEPLGSVPTKLRGSLGKSMPIVQGSEWPDTHSLHLPYRPPGLFSPVSVPNLYEELTPQLTEYQT